MKWWGLQVQLPWQITEPESCHWRWAAIPYHSTVSRTFDSLFKALFIFRSLYLFAIGLAPIFASALSGIHLTIWAAIPNSPTRAKWSVPINKTWRNTTITFFGVPFQATFAGSLTRNHRLTLQCCNFCNCNFWSGLWPVHSPLLGPSQLHSFPGLSDMLKFSP